MRKKKLCLHGKTRSDCMTCCNASICPHKRSRYDCRKCGGTSLCAHDKRRHSCWECSPLTRIQGLLSASKSSAKTRGYKPPHITAQEYLNLLRSSKVCAACGEPLNADSRRPHLHHNHDTGEVLGFVHSFCNNAEGYLRKIRPKALKQYMLTLFPEIFEKTA